MRGVPLVSILTPSLNQGMWLPDSLGSVARQTYARIEHVVADGGSTDQTLDLLVKANSVLWHSESDSGQADALNRAFARSSGEIIGWLNADDAYFDAEVVSDVVEVFRRRPDVGVVYGHALLVNSSGRALQYIWAPPFNRRFLRGYNFIVQPTAFVRRSALGATLVDERYDFAMDRELWLRLSNGWKFARLARPLAIDRHHPARKSIMRPDLFALDTERLVAEHGVPHGGMARIRVKLCKVGFRLVGLQGLRRLARTELAFDGHVDPTWQLALRQVAIPRARMPVEPSL